MMVHSLLAGEIVRAKLEEATRLAARSVEIERALEAGGAESRRKSRQSAASPRTLRSSLIELMTTSASGSSESSS